MKEGSRVRTCLSCEPMLFGGVNDIGDGYEYTEFRDLHAWCRFVLFLTLGA
jgi:hypothetical protein